MCEQLHHDSDYALGKDLPAEGQLGASIGLLFSTHSELYLEWSRQIRDESRQRFASTFAKLSAEDLQSFEDKFVTVDPEVPGIVPEEGIAD